MKKNNNHKSDNQPKISLEGYPTFPSSGAQNDKNPKNTEGGDTKTSNDLDFDGDIFGENLDITGSQTDDQKEVRSRENEVKNNYILNTDISDNLEEEIGV